MLSIVPYASVSWLDVVRSWKLSVLLSEQLSVFQSRRHVPERFYFPSYKWEQQIVAKFSTFKWVSVGCSWCLKAGKRPYNVGGSELCWRLLPPGQPLVLLLTLSAGVAWQLRPRDSTLQKPNLLSLSELNLAQNYVVLSEVLSSWRDFLSPEEALTCWQRSRRVGGIGGVSEEAEMKVYNFSS